MRMENGMGFILWFYIYLFRVFGYCPIALSPSNADRLYPVWQLFVLGLNNFVAVLVVLSPESYIFVGDSFTMFADQLKLLSLTVSLNVSAWQCIIMRQYERKFWSIYFKLRAERNAGQQGFYRQVQEHQTPLICLISAVAANVLTAFIIIYTDPISKAKRFIVTLSLNFACSVVRNVQYVFYINLIRLEIEYLEKDLATLVEFTEWGRSKGSFPNFDEFIRRRIIEKQRTYQAIFEMSENFQRACNWSMVASLLKGYIKAAVDIYIVVWLNVVRWKLIEDVLLIPAILEIPMFLLTAKSCMNAAKYISYRVHSLKRSDDSVATSVQIQNFSLQLLHQKIKIDGLGIASMDGYMLTKAIGSITTYMVFFIQFMPKFRSKFE